MTSDLRELDRRVAEAMGWEPFQRIPDYTSGALTIINCRVERQLPRYSTSIADAWVLVEVVHARGWDYELKSVVDEWGVEIHCCIFSNPSGYCWDGHDESAPLAICRAFLAAMEAK